MGKHISKEGTLKGAPIAVVPCAPESQLERLCRQYKLVHKKWCESVEVLQQIDAGYPGAPFVYFYEIQPYQSVWADLSKVWISADHLEATFCQRISQLSELMATADQKYAPMIQAERERVEAGLKFATHLLERRLQADNNWFETSGYNAAERIMDDLGGRREELANEINDCPCRSIEEVERKAALLLSHYATYEASTVENLGNDGARILKQIATGKVPS